MPVSGVQTPSFQSFFVEVLFRGRRLSTATAFSFALSEHAGAPACLITNRHVVTGRHAQTGECLDKKYAAVPDALRLHIVQRSNLRKTVPLEIPLLDAEGTPLWFETTSTLEPADVVALHLPQVADAWVQPHVAHENIEFRIQPTELVHIVGFPFGERTIDSFAIWATGHIATQPAFDHGDRPVFLVDARTRTGQSGSAVILYDGRVNTSRAAGHMIEVIPGSTRLLGVYSGRVNEESDLGMVWKTRAIVEVALKVWRHSGEGGSAA